MSVNASLLSVVETFAWPVLSEDLEIKDNWEVVTAERKYFSAIDKIPAGERE